MRTYALRYVPLLALALLLIPLRIMGWGQQGSLSFGRTVSPFRSGSALYGITMLSPDEGWAVGGFFTKTCSVPNTQDKTACPTAPYGGLILHYTNNAWVQAKVARTITLPLLAVSLDSPHDGWAVGYNATFVHYDGDTWSTIPGPANFNKNLFGVAMLSPADGWAVGYGGSILHYTGKQWSLLSSPTQFDLRSIAMSSAQEGWAVGDNGTILHYHAGLWQLAASPTHTTLNSISLLSAHEGWAVGKQDTILHYRAEAGTWEQVSCECQGNDLYGVAMNMITSGWAIGDNQFLTYRSEVWRDPDKLGTLSGNALPSKANSSRFNLYSIALSSSGQGWAVGRTLANNGDNLLVILRYQANTWVQFPINGV